MFQNFVVELEQEQMRRTNKKKKSNTFESINALYEDRELVLNAFKKEIFPLKSSQANGIKILTPKQMLRRLPLALTQVKAGVRSENLLKEIQ